MITKKIEITDTIVINVLKISRGKVTLNITTEHNDPKIVVRTLKKGDSYVYTLRLEDVIIA